jgi:phage terminase large subunit
MRSDAEFYSPMPKLEIPRKAEAFLKPARYKVAHGGRGSAKSHSFGRLLLMQGTLRPTRVLCAREFQASIDDSVHQLLSDLIEELGLQSVYTVERKAIYGPGGTSFAFEGLRHNVSKIRSYEGIDIVWVEEAEKVSQKSWTVLTPTIRKDADPEDTGALALSEGSEIWISFNPEFEDDYTFTEFVLNPPSTAIVVEMNWRDNPWFPKVLDNDRKEFKRRHPDDYDWVWEGKCRHWLEGAIYANELRACYDENRVTTVDWDENTSVFTAWDLGRTDSTAIWWYQLVAGEIHIIDAESFTGGDASLFASRVLGRQIQVDIIAGEIKVTIGESISGLEHRRKYVYETHWLPHDAKAKTHQAFGKSTRMQLDMALEGHGYTDIVPNLSIEDGIKATRTAFRRFYFDEALCVDGLKAIRRYKRKLRPDEVSLQPKPDHDWTSHFADALRMLSVAYQEETAPGPDSHTQRDAYGLDDDDGDSWKAA